MNREERRSGAEGKDSGARNDHRVCSITTLVDDINGARLSGNLAKKAADAPSARLAGPILQAIVESTEAGSGGRSEGRDADIGWLGSVCDSPAPRGDTAPAGGAKIDGFAAE